MVRVAGGMNVLVVLFQNLGSLATIRTSDGVPSARFGHVVVFMFFSALNARVEVSTYDGSTTMVSPGLQRFTMAWSDPSAGTCLMTPDRGPALNNWSVENLSDGVGGVTGMATPAQLC